MKVKNIPLCLALGFVGFLVLGAIGLNIYHRTYTRESYDITECSKKHRFLNLTFPRSVKLGTAVYVKPNLFRLSTVLAVYPIHELQEKGLLGMLYSEATNNPDVFLTYEEKNTNDAVVLLKAIPSENEGEEPIFCVVDKKEVGISDLLHKPDVFSVGMQWKRTKRDLPPTDHARRVISWGP